MSHWYGNHFNETNPGGNIIVSYGQDLLGQSYWPSKASPKSTNIGLNSSSVSGHRALRSEP